MNRQTRYPELDAESLRVAARCRTWQELAEAGTSDYKTILRARSAGFTVPTAEAWCDRLGVHPAEVWPGWVELVEGERRARYNARKAAAERARYAASEARREQAKENARRYYQECADYLKAQKRAYYAANRGRIAERRRARRTAA